MLISPSIASSDVLHVADEVDFACRYFDDVHIDIEDGVAVCGISFGMKMAKGICQRATKPTSLHLEVIHPLDYLAEVKECAPDVVFIQTDILPDPLAVVRAFQAAGLRTGVAVGNRDIGRDYDELFQNVEDVLVCTACHEDMAQQYQQFLEDYALSIQQKYHVRIWLDGGVNYQVYQKLQEAPVYALVMGRAVFSDKEKALQQFRPDGKE